MSIRAYEAKTNNQKHLQTLKETFNLESPSLSPHQKIIIVEKHGQPIGIGFIDFYDESFENVVPNAPCAMMNIITNPITTLKEEDQDYAQETIAAVIDRVKRIRHPKDSTKYTRLYISNTISVMPKNFAILTP